MRPIKFRAFIPSQKVMFEVGLIDENINTLGERSACTPIKVWRLHEEAVLMQFTGLHDKNGKEIWEGDVIKFDKFKNAKVFWNQTLCRFEYEAFIDGHRHSGGLCVDEPNDLKVIGNVWETPELIK